MNSINHLFASIRRTVSHVVNSTAQRYIQMRPSTRLYISTLLAGPIGGMSCWFSAIRIPSLVNRVTAPNRPLFYLLTGVLTALTVGYHVITMPFVTRFITNQATQAIQTHFAPPPPPPAPVLPAAPPAIEGSG
jgi:hypothetical protein